jgi:glyoxylase-like metal-dependent hydrolase (beta-lactamase superfamily II)
MDYHSEEEVSLNEPINQPNALYKSQSYPPYALPFGDTEIVVVSDGPLDLGTPEDSFRGVSKEEIDGQLLRNFLPTDRVVIEQNIPLLTLGGKRILFETGVGSPKRFGPHSGHLQTSLKEAAIDPGSIDAIVCSHPHPDHIGGICTDGGMPLFPNAQIYLSENDFIFWTDEKLLGTRRDLPAQIARKNLLPVRERIVFFNDEQEFLPGVQAMFTPGHTKEHACFIVTSGSQSMCLIGDLSHHPVLLLERPRSQFIYDLDPLQAAETRVKVLGMLSRERMILYGGHFPWPGIGYVAQEKDGFRYFPEAIKWIFK